MTPRSIRVKSVVLIEHDGHYLFEESTDRVKAETFYMPFGGGVEFGESTVDAALREVKEELGISIPEPELLGVEEDRFEFEATPCHDVVFIYHLVMPRNFDPASMIMEVLHGKELIPVWLTEQEIETSTAPFYPRGITKLIASLNEIPS